MSGIRNIRNTWVLHEARPAVLSEYRQKYICTLTEYPPSLPIIYSSNQKLHILISFLGIVHKVLGKYFVLFLISHLPRCQLIFDAVHNVGIRRSTNLFIHVHYPLTTEVGANGEKRFWRQFPILHEHVHTHKSAWLDVKLFNVYKTVVGLDIVAFVLIFCG